MAAQAQPEPAVPQPPADDFVFDLAELEGGPPENIAAIPVAEAAGESPPAQDKIAEAQDALEPAEALDEQVKVIGSLRIGIPLYNVYLNEADEWSRRLATEVAEWALELNQPLPDSTVGLAHALAGSSATVGFNTLSDIARALENTMMQTQFLAYGTARHGKAFTDAAEEIRRLLHQFAAGFLKEPDPSIIENLLALKQIEIPRRADTREDELSSEFADFDLDLPLNRALTRSRLRWMRELRRRLHRPPRTRLGPYLLKSPNRPSLRHQPAKREGSSADEADIDLVDAIDPDLFPIFEEEAAELMPQLGGALRQWTARPDNRSAREEVLRALHTLKGSARLAGALRLGEMAHRMESEVEYLGSGVPAVADLEALLQRFDGMQANWDALRASGGVALAAPQADAAVAPEGFAAGAAVPPGIDSAAVLPFAHKEAEPTRALLARPATTVLARSARPPTRRCACARSCWTGW